VGPEQGLDAARESEVLATRLPDVLAPRCGVLDPAGGVEDGCFVWLRRGHDNPR
jgi:hypothetical protein